MIIELVKSRVEVYPLSADELSCFGWGADEGLPLQPVVFATRTPAGMRCIPTRQKMSTGVIIYGSVETMEAPPHRTQLEWAEEFGSWEAPQPGPLL